MHDDRWAFFECRRLTWRIGDVHVCPRRVGVVHVAEGECARYAMAHGDPTCDRHHLVGTHPDHQSDLPMVDQTDPTDHDH